MRSGYTLDRLVAFRQEEADTLFQLQKRRAVTLSNGLRANKIEYRTQLSPNSCIMQVSGILVLVGSQAFELSGSASEHSEQTYRAAIDFMMFSFNPPFPYLALVLDLRH